MVIEKGAEHSELIYVVKGVSKSRIAVSLQQETRRDKEGNLVDWDIALRRADIICWNRSDWQSSTCTNNLVRCMPND
jgi:hypothetical protein